MIETETQEENVQVFSVKLITGENLISEMYLNEDNESVSLVNPISVSFKETEEHGEIIIAKEFDPFTDDAVVAIPFSSILIEPNEVSVYFYDYYVNALLYLYVKRTKNDLARIDIASAEELENHVKEAQKKVSDYVDMLNERYGTELEFQSSVSENPLISKTVH